MEEKLKRLYRHWFRKPDLPSMYHETDETTNGQVSVVRVYYRERTCHTEYFLTTKRNFSYLEG